jgi:hypothetical protein
VSLTTTFARSCTIGAPVNANLLRGLHIPPYPGFGQGGKVPGRYGHLVQLKNSVQERAWAHWLAAPGTVTHATAAQAARAGSTKGPHSSSATGRRESSGSTIRLTGPAPARETAPATSAEAVPGAVAAATAGDEPHATAMDVEEPPQAVAAVEEFVGAAAKVAPARVAFLAVAPAAKRRRMRLLQGRGAGLFGSGGAENSAEEDDS